MVCELLQWDTDFFGFSVARVIGAELDEKTARKSLKWCEDNEVKCLYFLTESSSSESCRVAHVSGFQMVDVRLDLRSAGFPTMTSRPPEMMIRQSEAGDIPALEAIARKSHRDSRFFFDHRFPRRRSEELFATWIRKECNGRADMVFIALDGKTRPAGYISCKADPFLKIGQIGLFAVEERMRSRGVGKGLICQALKWFQSANIKEVHVITQLRNVAGQRLYQACGFRTYDVKIWFHKWF